MRSFRKFATLAACVGVLSGAQLLVAKEAGKEVKTEAPKEKKTEGKRKRKKGGSEQKEKGKLSVPILKGHDTYGLKIPYTDSEGNLQMIFNIGQASRVDENRVSMKEMHLETYDDDGKAEMTIELPQSVLDLSTRIITTDTNVTIKRSDFQITGRSMKFNTETKQGTLSGNVRMLIYDLGEAEAPVAKEEKITQ
jgi:hypothetical protein